MAYWYTANAILNGLYTILLITDHRVAEMSQNFNVFLKMTPGGLNEL